MISAGARPSCSHIRLSVQLIFLILALQRAQAQTTERYLGCKQRIRSAVNDRIGVEPNP